MLNILTPAHLEKLRNWPHLRDTWYFISAAVLTVNNKPHAIPHLYKYTTTCYPLSQHMEITNKFRESIFKTAALAGLPKVINSLTELKNATPLELRAHDQLRPDKTDFKSEGENMFDHVYGKVSERVQTNMKAAYPDLWWFVLNFQYGPLLSNTEILSAKETSLVILSALVPQNVDPQLKGHLKGAVNSGATIEEVNAARHLAIELSEWCGMELNPEEISSL